MVGVLMAVGVTVGGAYVTHALDPVDAAATVGASARRLEPPPVGERQVPTTLAPPVALADTVLELLNGERVNAGLAPYAVHPAVSLAAQSHSDDMAAHAQLSHTGSDGSNTGDRLTRQSFSWVTWGENIAAGQTTAQQAVSAWMKSSGHRPQMLGTYQFAGVGVAAAPDGTLYWTLVVASGS